MTDISNLPSNILIALATGRNSIARDLLAKIIRQEPQNAAAWLALAVTLPTPEAVLVLRRVLMIEPDNSIALQSLLRLREDDRAGLALSDVWPQEVQAEEAPALFEHEETTVSLRSSDLASEEAEARFGDECATLPIAFQSLFIFSDTTKATPTQAQTVETSRTATALADPPTPARSTVYRPSATWPASFQKPLVSPETPKINLSVTRTPERVQPDYVSNPVTTQYSPLFQPTEALSLPRTMPKLNSGPRPQLGMMPEPILGFTPFGLLVMLAAIGLLVLACLVIL